MRLEVGSIAIQEIEFGSRTALQGHTLVVSRDDVRQIVLEDPHFADVDVHIARPGESVRIIHALDVVEPRWKVAGPGGVFPGFVSPPSTVGEGRTHRLAGVAVVEVGQPVPGEPTYWRERLVDMAGPGAAYSPFARTLNLVLDFKPNLDYFPAGSAEVKDVLYGGAAAADYNRAIELAGMKVAARLGRTTQDVQPDQVETFELAPCDPGLPRVVCIYQFLERLFLYGSLLTLPAGTMIHPNEAFDGALISWRYDVTTASIYGEQNNALLQELCRRHGRDVNFLGCILFSGPTRNRDEKDRVASAVSKLARVMGAQAALFLGVNGSNYSIDLMWAIQKCEQAGIRTTLIYQDVGHGPEDPGFIFSLPEADAIVCTGSRDQIITLPRLEKLIGGDHLVNPDVDATGELTIPIWYLHSSLGDQGDNRLLTRFE